MIAIFLGRDTYIPCLSKGGISMINSSNQRLYIYGKLKSCEGSEQGGRRPVLIIQNDTGNKYSPTIIVAALTSHVEKAKLPTHVELSSKEHGLEEDSIVLLEQLRTIDKSRLEFKITELDRMTMLQVDEALRVSLNLEGAL